MNLHTLDEFIWRVLANVKGLRNITIIIIYEHSLKLNYYLQSTSKNRERLYSGNVQFESVEIYKLLYSIFGTRD